MPDNNVSGMFSNGFPIPDGFYLLPESSEHSQPEGITAPIVAMKRKVNLNVKICLCTEGPSFWLCMCCYNFKDYLVYSLQVNSLTRPLRPGFLLLPVHVKNAFLRLQRTSSCCRHYTCPVKP